MPPVEETTLRTEAELAPFLKEPQSDGWRSVYCAACDRPADHLIAPPAATWRAGSVGAETLTLPDVPAHGTASRRRSDRTHTNDTAITPLRWS